jgi:hypothetical protein
MSVSRSTEVQEQETKNARKKSLFVLSATGLSFDELKNPSKATMQTLLKPINIKNVIQDSLIEIQDAILYWPLSHSESANDKICYLEVLYGFDQPEEIPIEDVIKLYPESNNYNYRIDYEKLREFEKECNTGFANPFFSETVVAQYNKDMELFRIQRRTFFKGLSNQTTGLGVNDDQKVMENSLRPLRKFFSSKPLYDSKNLPKEILSFVEPKKPSFMNSIK